MKQVTKKLTDVITIDPDTQWVEIDYDAMNFKKTDLARPAAVHFEEYGYYCPYAEELFPEKWRSFWEEEQRRCREGYTTEEGLHVTGRHYFYMNYSVIILAEDVLQADGSTTHKRQEGLPKFYDGDWLFFQLVDLARKMNKHMAVLKARRKGYSYKCGSMLAYNYYHHRNTKGYAFASEQKYLDEDGILSKTWDVLTFIDEHTAWTQPRQKKDQNMHKRSSMIVKENGIEIEKGLKNDIIGVTLKDNPDKIRGKAGELLLYEEMGKFPGLLQAWQIASPTVKQGSKTLGTMLAFGTGGTEDADFESAEEMFYNPEPYDILAFNNIWDEGAYGSECGFFVPNYINLDGFIDPDGNSQIPAAREFEQKERQRMKKANSVRDYEQYVAEHAETPNEAVLQTEANLFPVIELNEQYNLVRANHKDNIITKGNLLNKGGRIIFKPDSDARMITTFPHRKDDDLRGCVAIKEAPYKTKDGSIPRDMYFLCHDPYAHDSSSNKQSLGAAFVIKRTNQYSLTYNECIVASYVGRPSTQDEYNRNLFMLAQYYNAKIGFENDRGEVIPYAKRFKKLHLLHEEFEMLHKKELQSRTVSRAYGMHMTPARKEQGELYIRDWLNTVIRIGDDGEEIKVLHTIYDLALLRELIKFDLDGNFDRVMALMIGMFMSKEMYNKEVRTGPLRNPNVDMWFDRHYSTTLNP